MDKILVYGATGAQGAAVVEELLANGETVKVLVRSREKAAQFEKRGAEIAFGDFNDYESLVAASHGADKVSLVLPLIFDAETFFDYGKRAVDAAREAGVKLLVYNSGVTTPDDHSEYGFLNALRRVEDYALSKMPTVVLRPPLYLDNLLAPWTLPLIFSEKTISYPVAPAHLRLNWISHRNLGRFVAAALNRPDSAGEIFEIAGNEPVSGLDIAEALSAQMREKISYQSISPQEFGERLTPVLGTAAGDELTTLYKVINQNDCQILRKDALRAITQLKPKLETFADWVNRFPQAS